MANIQVLNEQFIGTDLLTNWRKAGHNIIGIDNFKDISPYIPVYCFSDLTHPHVRQWLNANQLAIYGGRGYVGNHLYKQRWLSRFSINGWANIVMKPIPYSRWGIMKLEKHKWKVKEVKNVLIAPSKATSSYWPTKHEEGWANYMASMFPGANVKIRWKEKKPGLRWMTLWKDFDWADLVVSQSSAITAEAFWYGKKVLSTEPCTTWAAHKTTLSDWQDPTEPSLRDEWHEHLAWCQYNEQEFTSGLFLNLLEKYIGPFETYRSDHIYNMTI
jgi:hypothetical protein